MNEQKSQNSAGRKQKYVRAVGPRLRIVLYIVFALVALLAANSAYLAGITFLEWFKNQTYVNYFYPFMFLGHLALGLLLLIPFILFAALHLKNAYNRPNRRAVRVGFALLTVSLILLFSGFALMRLDFFEIKNPNIRSLAYWAHVISPLLAIWLYILHRLAGPRIKWKAGFKWGGAVAGIVGVMIFFHTQDPREWNVVGPKEGEKYFRPSLARTVSGNFIPAKTLMMDSYCVKCHPDTHEKWYHSAHHFSSFNNEPYLFSVRETRKVAFERDGNVQAARFCAGCHDPVPFFSGAFDNPNYDDVNDPTAKAGITCTVCHSITHINSNRGNSDYTIDEPIHYPFAFSKNRLLQFINQQLVKAKPEFHKKTFLKPLHKTAEFCSLCHKVNLPGELTKYKEWLRGQNHYDSYLLSGVSGHGVRSFYYPEKAVPNCSQCHMPLFPTDDFGAKFFDGSKELVGHDHLFPSANTGIAYLKDSPETIKAHQEFLNGVMRVDIFGLREGGTIDGQLLAPLRPEIPHIKPGEKYLVDTVIRTVKMGHHFTQGTADSNEIWMDITVKSGDRVIGRNGGLGPDKEVDPWSHFVNAYVLDRDGNRIDRRNAQDIFVPLYNHQIPPGAGQLVQYGLTIPKDVEGPITIEVKLQYRKFDTRYMKYVFGEDYVNELPITTLAEDAITLPLEGENLESEVEPSPIIPWQRWNDYGIGLLLEGNTGSEKGQLRQAAYAFSQVEKLGRPDGPLNLARVFFKEGRLDDAAAALKRAVEFDPPANRWTAAWFTGMVNKQNGHLDEAITQFRSILEDRYPELIERGFDFTKDYVLLDELGQTYVERSKLERGPENLERRNQFLRLAEEQFLKALEVDSENLTAHYNLALIYEQLGENEKAQTHWKLHAKYKPDDNARDRAIAIQRRKNPAADHAAQAIVIYPLQRSGAPELPASVGAIQNVQAEQLSNDSKL